MAIGKKRGCRRDRLEERRRSTSRGIQGGSLQSILLHKVRLTSTSLRTKCVSSVLLSVLANRARGTVRRGAKHARKCHAVPRIAAILVKVVPMASMRRLLFLAACSLLAAKARAVGYCNDIDDSCANWASAGECTGTNAEVVLRACPHTCGVCTIKCEDTEESCGSWAKAGHCKDNADYMMRRCPTSCGLCSPTCADLHDDCPGWTQAGACTEVRRHAVPPKRSFTEPSRLRRRTPTSC